MEGISGEAAPIEGGAGSVKVVLCGHSMGGLVAVDAALEIAKSCDGGSKNDGKLWPRVCGVIAFDTPVRAWTPVMLADGAADMLT